MAKKSEKKILKNKNDFISGNFKCSLTYLKKSKGYIWFSFILFLIIAFFGYFFPIFFKEEVMEIIKNLINQTSGLNGVELILFIINNNMTSSFYGLILGIIFGIIPLGVIVMNGYLLGFVANKSVASGGILILWKLFPHGIFEIPAVMISIGLGIKLGISLIKNTMLFYNPKIKKPALYSLMIASIALTLVSFPIILIITLWNKPLRTKLFLNLVESIRVFLLIVIPLLIIAGIIEGSLIWLFR
ncbi:MAG: stage II sporulation protein M [Candidatus Pacearchaeota archaeon]|jgi:stage II sporulation protein M